MVKRGIQVRGVGMDGSLNKAPVLLQMNDDDFPARFLRDLASPGLTPISSTAVVNTAQQPLFQPVQRMVNVALVELNCNFLNCPRVDPRRILSAGVVVRRALRQPGSNGGPAWDDVNTLAGWMRDSSGRSSWVELRPDQADLDPDPTQRPQLKSGQPEIDRQLEALAESAALTESTTPAFAAPPATCASLDRTVVYAVIPTASSEVSDTGPAMPPNIDQGGLIGSLPALLRSSQGGLPLTVPIPGMTVDARWMSDDFLDTVFPSTPGSSTANSVTLPQPDPRVAQFQMFSIALRMLHSVFGAFDGTAEGSAILAVLNRRNVTFGQPPYTIPVPMGDFYQAAKVALLDSVGVDNSSSPLPTVLMPDAWDALSDSDQASLVGAMTSALTPRSQALLAPQGRFQDASRLYRLRLFFRLKPDNPGCPPKLVWSRPSEPFRIAAWHESSQRAHPPIPLPDPTLAYMKSAKPNCAFHVPANLMNAMQGTTLKGMMDGSKGGGGFTLDWICGFNIPLITICAFFVLNIFLQLLNIIFFWLPFIKICIPFPAPAPSAPDRGTP